MTSQSLRRISIQSTYPLNLIFINNSKAKLFAFTLAKKKNHKNNISEKFEMLTVQADKIKKKLRNYQVLLTFTHLPIRRIILYFSVKKHFPKKEIGAIIFCLQRFQLCRLLPKICKPICKQSTCIIKTVKIPSICQYF